MRIIKDEFAKAINLLAWNKRMLTMTGLWPESRSDFLFTLLVLYYIYHVAMIYVTLYLVIGHFLLFTKIFTESLAYTHILIRFVLLRKHLDTFRILFDEIRKDYDAKNYKSEEEAQAFLTYNTLAKSVIKILLTFPTFTSILYYFKPLLIRHLALRAVRLAHKNVTIPYMMPFSFYKIYKITNDQTFALTYVSQFPFAFLIAAIQSGTDCLVLTLGCHLCGRLSALSQRIRKLNVNADRREFKAIIITHQQLLRIGKLIQDSLSSFMLIHLIVASTLICIVIFQIIINLVPGKRINLVNIFVLLSVNILRLYSHCWVGEYLIQESDSVNAAFYECEWYDIPPRDRKMIILNLLKSQTPIRLVAGGFGTFSITVFADVMKSAMAYLSFLRNFI